MSKHILVVDDDEMIRRIIRAGLESEGYRLSVLTDGRAVMSHLRQNNIDLVILDIFMEGKEGFETALEIIQEFPTLPVLMISSDAGYLNTAEAFVQDTLLKPISIPLLRQKVSALLTQ